jgi:hypothetical protein
VHLHSFDHPKSKNGYDVVTVVHHDDMQPLINYGIQSFVDKLLDFPSDARIYAICTKEALEILLGAKKGWQHNNTYSVWSRVYPVNENIFPFNLSDIKVGHNQKPTWVYQQLLKLYAHRTLVANGYPVYRKFVVIDADTILTTPLYMEEPVDKYWFGDVYRRPFFCIASVSSGAFENDALVAGEMVRNLLFVSRSFFCIFRL